METAFGIIATDRSNTGDINRRYVGMSESITTWSPATLAIQQHKHELMLLSQFRNQHPCCNLTVRWRRPFPGSEWKPELSYVGWDKRLTSRAGTAEATNTRDRIISHFEHPFMADH